MPNAGTLLADAIKAIEIRNRIVHEGEHPSASDADCLRSLLLVVAAILEADHKFPALTTSNALGPKPTEE
jgi:hypothetical protein